MALIEAKAPQDVSQEDLNWLVNAAKLGADFIKNGAPKKGAQVLSDISNHFAAEGSAPVGDEVKVAAGQPCSSCYSLMPNLPAYEQCMLDCTG